MIPIQECSPLVNKDETKGAVVRKSSSGKSVQFREEHNRYYEGGMTAEQEEIWYSKAELGCFTTNYQQAGKVMAICNPNARTWFQILQRSYKNSIKRSIQPMVGTVGNDYNHQQQLISMYKHDDNMVGIEDLLFARLRVDGERRRQSLVKGIRQVTNSHRLSPEARSYHIRVMSQKVCQPSRLFAHDIARAQWESTLGSGRQEKHNSSMGV